MPGRRREQLVVQHLENISREALEEHQDIIKKFVRKRFGIYALYRKEKLYYVGLASDLRNRLRGHLRNKHGESWDRFSVYLTRQDSHLRELEAILLRTVKPKGNSQAGKFVKSQDLKRAFARDVRQKYAGLIDQLIGRSAAKPIIVERLEAGRRPVLAEVELKRPCRLKATYKRKTVKARVRRDGTIRFNGRVFTSPSKAACAATRLRAVNGWWFWKYERSPGDWVRLSKLRD
jgi:hypothetical protein